MIERWPVLPGDWSGTRDAMHLVLQIVGKYRLARTPWYVHSWHATLYPTPRGLTTGAVRDGDLTAEVRLDLIDDAVVIETSAGRRGEVALCAQSVASFDRAFREALGALDLTPDYHGRPNELADATAFAEDTQERPWDGDAARAFMGAVLSAHRVFEAFRTGWLGKASPIHLFWGSFDLAVTRCSFRDAPVHPGGIPNLPDEITREAYSHELASAGFWPGGGPVEEAAFYAYAYPTPDGFGDAMVPHGAYWHDGAGEFLLPYSKVRGLPDADDRLLAFLQSTFDAAARLGDWDHERLACPVGQPLRPRPLTM